MKEDPISRALHAECDRWEAESQEILERHQCGGDIRACVDELTISLMFSQMTEASIIFGPAAEPQKKQIQLENKDFAMEPEKILLWALLIAGLALLLLAI